MTGSSVRRAGGHARRLPPTDIQLFLQFALGDVLGRPGVIREEGEDGRQGARRVPRGRQEPQVPLAVVEVDLRRHDLVVVGRGELADRAARDVRPVGVVVGLLQLPVEGDVGLADEEVEGHVPEPEGVDHRDLGEGAVVLLLDRVEDRLTEFRDARRAHGWPLMYGFLLFVPPGGPAAACPMHG